MDAALQYKIEITASKIYEYSTVRELSGLLEKEVNKQDVVVKQAPLNADSLLSVDNVLLQVKQKRLGIARADKLLKELGV